jgi:hypothetical protein
VIELRLKLLAVDYGEWERDGQLKNPFSPSKIGEEKW